MPRKNSQADLRTGDVEHHESTLATKPLPNPLIEQMKALGWVELARVPGC